MTEMVNAGNALSRALLQILAPTLPGAHVGRHFGRFLSFVIL